MKSKAVILWIAIFAFFALLLGVWTQYNLAKNHPLAHLESATVLSVPRPLQAFQLTDDQNHPFTQDNLKQHWSLIFFGFTHCPMLCPTTLATLKQAMQILGQESPKSMPQIVFISVDPERDTPNVIRKYLSSFNKDFLGATGEKSQMDALTQQFNVMYAKIFPSGEKNHYTIDHSGTILLVNPKGELYAIFSTPHDAHKIAHDMANIMNDDRG